jgi:hypothetical protein
LLGSQNGAITLIWSAINSSWLLSGTPVNWTQVGTPVDGSQVHVDGTTITGLGTRQFPLIATGSGLLSTAAADVTTDQTVGATPALLFSVAVDVADGASVIVNFSACAQNSAAGNFTRFILMVDGVASSPPKGATIVHTEAAPNNQQCACIDARLTGLTTGSHTIGIQWVASAGTSSILGATGSLQEHGTLLVETVNV